MSEIENNEPVEFAPEEEVVDPIEVIYTGTCESLSGRSDLTFSIGRHSEDGTMYLALTGNSGKGIFSSQFVPATAIQDVVIGAHEVTGQSLKVLYPSVSTNSNAFLLSVLRAIGLVEVNPEQTRQHRHVGGMTVERCVSALMSHARAVKPEAGGRKTLKLKPKEG
jgi:hypothetical protein